MPSVVMDGIQTHHFRAPDTPAAAERIADRVAALAADFDAAGAAELHDLLAEQRALAIADDLLRMIRTRRGPEGLSSEGLRTTALWLCEHGTRREAVKIGIALLGETAQEPDLELLLRLGALEELTLFAVVAVKKNWAAPGVYRLARRVEGWGRIHAVERLKGCDDPQVKAWLLRGGYRNGVLDEYLSWIAATTGDLLGALQAPSVDDELLDGAGGILHSLAVGGPAEDIRHYDDALAALHRYIDLVGEAEPTLRRLCDLAQITRLLRGDRKGLDWPEGAREQVVARIDRLLERPVWSRIALAHLAEPEDDYTFNKALSCAFELGLEVRGHVLDHLEDNPGNRFVWQWAMLWASAEDVGELVACAEHLLLLNPLGGGPEEGTGSGGREVDIDDILGVIVQELGRFPGAGTALVRAALVGDMPWNRNMALRTLTAWSEHDPAALPADAAEWLHTAEQQEPNEKVRETIVGLLTALPPTPPT
ncbi:hypothetical protein O4J56_12760 [Nocardiopsis sp. RSe5-2]|uniref:HEAT repeat domain-containing protein n=1 Tax=Nocardiopsis endophytica TaxID=3018445 RepID=A0ABT4U4Y1_9ACTN|nr:hypothetical protein [Nocardiopsis endophytica]MDA2811505.1 hypothetical protein [Nocardiopsis endophytica]